MRPPEWLADAAQMRASAGAVMAPDARGAGLRSSLRTRKPKLSPDGALAQYLVEGLPVVGPETARRLVSHFGSPRGVFAAGAPQLRECKGVGPKTADGIAAALDLKPTGYRQT